ncbi:carboxypeptidase-like regulatory domain-containing protein [Larkinella knui]|uniref:TonB-dependent receptor n=1 Tax=Larkinella knui TaxID=2025310 RepID=A0A3P1CUC5_9BACT|nr:TonB-dependent receptor [Larkinella knui]RRB16917.1 TonB-dependent receptor [Larkinella knui]
MKRIVFLLLLAAALLVSYRSRAQTTGQTIKGLVFDRQSQAPLPGVNLIVVGLSPQKGATSDGEGHVRITDVTPGRYDLKASGVGYKELLLPNVLVTAGKQVVLEIGLEEYAGALQEVVVRGTRKNATANEMTTVSGRSFSMEEASRYAGGRADPARLVANFAGVSAPNDYRNDIIVRGNSPTGVLWRIEGLNVPSPNHFATLSATGAPVTLLNTNVLRSSDFFTSAFPAEYGNATAGVFDVGLRNGTTDKPEHTLQFGLFTGLEAVSEGPLRKGGNASYLVAYRYSFTGLAKELGIPIGSTAIPHYQDVSFKINSGTTRVGRFTLFGVGGLSDIAIKHDEIDSSDVFADPRRDTYSRSKLGFVGLRHTLRLGKDAYWNTVLGTSYSGNASRQDTLQEPATGVRVREVNSRETRYSFHTVVNAKLNARFTARAGLQGEFYQLNLLLRDREYTPDWNYVWDSKRNTQLWSAYLQARYSLTGRLTLNAGVRTQHLTLNQHTSLEPRLGLQYQINERSSLSAAYGYHSQMQPLNVYFYRGLLPDGQYDESNQQLDFTTSQHWVLGYDLLPFENWRIKLEAYYQRLSQVPVTRQRSSFSLLNEGASYQQTEQGFLINHGTGTNRGVELTVEKFFSRGFYGLLTGSVYQSTYQGSDQIRRSTAFDGRFVYNLLVGKEFKIGRLKQNALTVDYKVTHAGGRPYTPVDLAASQRAGKEVLLGDSDAFSQRLPDFFRMDIKVGVTFNSKQKKRTHAIYYDLQNVTNNQNVFARQYNKVTRQVNTAYQIGFIPNFVYKLQF